MDDVRVLTDGEAVETALDPMRAAILDALAEPGSATTVAAAIGTTRQKANYHLRLLEQHGLVEEADSRAWGGIRERFLQRTARHLVVSPQVLAGTPLDPDQVGDRLSADYLVAVSARSVAELGDILSRVEPGVRVPTLTVDTVIGFASPDDRAMFADELQAAVASLAAKYHHDDGRPHRVTVASYPRPKESR